MAVSKKDILDYISHTLENTNINVLGPMLDEFEGYTANFVNYTVSVTNNSADEANVEFHRAAPTNDNQIKWIPEGLTLAANETKSKTFKVLAYSSMYVRLDTTDGSIFTVPTTYPSVIAVNNDYLGVLCNTGNTDYTIAFTIDSDNES